MTPHAPSAAHWSGDDALLAVAPAGVTGALVAGDPSSHGAPRWLDKAGRRVVRALAAAGFGPIVTLFLRHPRLATAFWLPILTLSAIALLRGDMLASVLGLYVLGLGMIFANAGAHDLLRDLHPPQTPTTE